MASPSSAPAAMQLAHEVSAAAAEEVPAGDEATYQSDAFRMQCMKVLPCSKRFVHDWTECPFAHPQEKARRRDPRVHNYTGIACPSMKKEGCCAFSDHCPYAHNVFEYWLHPTRYRTQLCNDGSNCKRKICFFAHSLDELRVPACKPFVSPEALAAAAASAAADAEAKRKAATIGSPLSAFTALSPGPSPQRSSLDALRGAQEASARMAAGVAAPASPSTGDEAMAASPATTSGNSAVQAALQQLTGAGFSSQEHQVIELVTSLLAQDKVSPEQAASILQQMLPPTALSSLQAHLNTPRASMEDIRCYSDPLGYRSQPAQPQANQHVRASFDGAHSGMADPRSVASALLASSQPQQLQQQQARQQPQMQQQALTLEQMAAMQAAQNMGMHYSGQSSFQAAQEAHERERESRQSFESARSSFDTARMSFEGPQRTSFDYTPRQSLDSAYPSHHLPHAASWTGQGSWGAQLSSVPEQFPLINAPPPSSSWGGGGRFSLDAGTDRISEDMGRMSFEAAPHRAAPQTANPYASSFFASAGALPSSAPTGASMAERAAMGLPPLPPLRTAATHNTQDGEPASPASKAAAHHHQQLLGGTALHCLQ